MLPSALARSSRRYKDDTNLFTKWHSETAVSCAWKASQQQRQKPNATPGPTPVVVKEPKLKGRARKLARDADKAAKSTPVVTQSTKATTSPAKLYLLSTKDLLEQAKLVSESAKSHAKIPIAIQQVVRRAIAARRRCSDWFQKTRVDNEYSNAGHLHFIKVLEQAQDLLCGNMEGFAVEAKSVKDSVSAVFDHSSASSLTGLGTRFDALQLEELEDAEEFVTPSESIRYDSTGKAITADVYELEVDPDLDVAFDVFCLFEDLHRIQAFVKDAWTRFRDGNLDLITAATTANAAIDLVRRMEDDLIAVHPGRFHKPQSYQSLLGVIFNADSIRDQGHHAAGTVFLDPRQAAEFDEAVYLFTFRTLSICAHFLGTQGEFAYPPAVFPAQKADEAHSEWREWPLAKQWETEETLLTQLLMDIYFEDEIKDQYIRPRGEDAIPAVDEIPATMLLLIKKKEISLRVVFAARLYLDSHAILPPTDRAAFQELQERVETAKMTILPKKDQGVSQVEFSEKWVPKGDHLFKSLYNMLRGCIPPYVFRSLK